MALLKLNLFAGPILLDANGQRIELRSKKAIGLLAYLALHGGQSFTRDQLAEYFWPSSDAAQARQSLRQTFVELRRHLRDFEHVIALQDNRVMLDPDAISVDVTAFLNGMKLGEVPALLAAIQQYGDSLLPGFELKAEPFDTWLQQLRRQLDEHMRHALQELADDAFLDARFETAIGYLERALRLDAAFEPAHRRLIEIYLRTDRNELAVQQYQQLSEILHKRQLGQPNPSTRHLIAPLLATGASERDTNLIDRQLAQPTRIPTQAQLCSMHSGITIPILERTGVIQPILDQLAQPQRDNIGHCFILRGPAGSGKTSLTQQITRQAKSLDYSCLWVNASSDPRPSERLLARLVSQLSELVRKQGKPASLGSARNKPPFHLTERQNLALAELLDQPAPKQHLALLDAMPIAVRQQARVAVAVHLLQLAAQQPILLILEDIQYSDVLSQQLLTRVFNAVAALPIVVIATLDNRASVPAEWLTPSTHLTVIDIPALDRETMEQLAEHFPCHDSKYRYLCLRQCQGNPLFLLQLLQNPIQHALYFPASIQESILVRIMHLKQTDKQAIELASLTGDEFSWEVVQTLLDDRNYEPDSLLQQGLLVRRGEYYRFAHDEIRNSIYQHLPADKRRALHQKFARHYQYVSNLIYAYHLAAADDPRAVTAYLSAAQTERDNYRHDDALIVLEKAAQLCIEPDRQYDIAMQLGELALETRQAIRAIAYYEHALKYRSDAEYQAKAWIGMARGLMLRQEWQPAMNLLDRANQILADSEAFSSLSELHYYRGILFIKQQHHTGAYDAQRLSQQFAELSNSDFWRARSAFGLAKTCLDTGRFQPAVQYAQHSLQIARQANFGRFEIPNRIIMALCYMLQGQLQTAQQHWQHAKTMAEAIGDDKQQSNLHLHLALTAWLTGDLALARQHANQAHKLARYHSAPVCLAYALAYQALFEQPEAQADDERIDQAYMLITEHADPVLAAPILAILARLSRDPQRRHWALQEGERLLRPATQRGYTLLFYLLAIETTLHHANWEQALNLADRLIVAMHVEPASLFILFAERARVLAKIQQGDHSAQIRADLDELEHQTQRLGLLSLLPAYATARRLLPHHQSVTA